MTPLTSTSATPAPPLIKQIRMQAQQSRKHERDSPRFHTHLLHLGHRALRLLPAFLQLLTCPLQLLLQPLHLLLQLPAVPTITPRLRRRRRHRRRVATTLCRFSGLLPRLPLRLSPMPTALLQSGGGGGGSLGFGKVFFQRSMGLGDNGDSGSGRLCFLFCLLLCNALLVTRLGSAVGVGVGAAVGLAWAQRAGVGAGYSCSPSSVRTPLTCRFPIFSHITTHFRSCSAALASSSTAFFLAT